MQSYTEIPSSQSLQTSLSLLLSNDKTALSCSSGTTFPTVSIQVGMLCFRTDQLKLYQLLDMTPTWVLVADLSSGIAVSPSSAKLSTARNIAGVSFDGTADIAIAFAGLSSKPTTVSGYGITDIGSYSFPTGTRMPFAQASAPTGWTQDISDNANNRMLRVVNTAGNGIGGSHSPILNNVVPTHTHGFTTGNQSSDHTHYFVTNNNGQHNHSISMRVGTYTVPTSGVAPGAAQSDENPSGRIWTNGDGGHQHNGTTGGLSSSHTHSGTTDNGSSSTNWTPRYIDMIICTKN